jgi:hypothetical protein
VQSQCNSRCGLLLATSQDVMRTAQIILKQEESLDMEKLYLKEIEDKNKKEGRVLPPVLLYFLGVPMGLCLILWLLFFRG